MKFSFKKILLSAGALLLVGGICGCSIKFGTNPAIDPNEIVAHATAGDNIDDMKITYGEFEREYLFYLKSSRIDDDTAASVVNDCKERRTNIINNLIFECIVLQKAHDLGLDVFTEEELERIDKEYAETIDMQVKYLGENSATYGYEPETPDDLGVPLTDEEIERRGNLLFDKMLEESNMSRDVMMEWQRASLITEKLYNEIVKDADRNMAVEAVEESIKRIKEMYETDTQTYESGNYYKLYIPEGSRRIQHILLGFEDEDLTQISALREEGKDDEANELRSEKAAELQDKLDEVLKRIDDGEEFTKLITEYSADVYGSSMYPEGYLVVPNGQIFMSEFQDAAFEIEEVGGTTTCVTDFGVHIMLYAAEAVTNQEDYDTTVENAYAQLQQTHFNEIVAEWLEEYNFEIEYDVLRIDNPNAEEESSQTE